MELLAIYFILAIAISFLCSILEAVLLSANMSYVSVLEKERPKTGALIRRHKEQINKSIASILILNTIAHTLGAAGVGSQAELVFGSQVVFYISVVLTFAILFLSEIIPKTIGAFFWKELLPMTAYMIRFFIWITYPILVITLFVTDRISKGKKHAVTMTKEEILETTLQGESEGVIDEKESGVIENVLQLNEIRVNDILTPRSVMFALEENLTIAEVVSSEPEIFNFSRVPIYREDIDHIVGIVLTKKIFEQALKNDKATLEMITKPIFQISKNLPVSRALDLFVKKKDHIFLVHDKYDQTEGIVTLEDCIETLLGIEIMDESDDVEDMRELAKAKMKLKRRNREKDKG